MKIRFINRYFRLANYIILFFSLVSNQYFCHQNINLENICLYLFFLLLLLLLVRFLKFSLSFVTDKRAFYLLNTTQNGPQIYELVASSTADRTQ